jgi:phosphohistidine phosphatase
MAVDLYLIRHADALPLGEGGTTDDADRPLSDEGRQQAQRLTEALQRHGIRPAKVLTSPLLRARDTAEGILRHWTGDRPELVECPELKPGFRQKRLARVLEKLDDSSVALVGHQPDLGRWAAWLIGSKKAQVEFAKGGMAYLACEEDVRRGAGSLVWLVTSEWLKK